MLRDDRDTASVCMNKEESLELFAKGRDAWNAWAEKMSDERYALQADGNWVEGRSEPEWNEATLAWHAAAAADFSKYTFEETADFSGFVFPGDARFGEATFTGEAGFEGATFTGEARFGETTFTDIAWFDGATFTGEVWFGKATFTGAAWFGAATFTDNAWFDGATFTGEAWFGGATFTAPARFREATFTDNVWFDGSIFRDYAWFEGATFAGEAGFVGATFTGSARFDGATFTGKARFGKATFTGEALFLQAIFGGYAAFENAKFERSANFRAFEAKRMFSLDGATFLAVPDFIQAHFAEAPRLDDSRIEPPKISVKGIPDLAARWRALKRLAIQGHDHAREQDFFKDELKARRQSQDKPWQAVFWFGWFYQVLSDFGHSTWRPLMWWGVSVACFALLYLGQHPVLAKESSSRIIQRLTGSGGEVPPLTCVAGPGEPWVAALNLSFHKGLLFLGLVPANKLNQIFACLYGIHPVDAAQPSQLPDSFSPVIPDGATALGFVQHPLSAVLIFLFLLAIRNHFRIK